ncbi:quinoprotein dehydrogenase-associated putative ABC transporter substrate-binding protein [Methyloligella solikamskensis]|uniref:Quinoprotein dehydrogenase-associated putative ABC transporter substrate-binding protein n=1 Tax=Methyloligella solikamskensis TaxID=1177756 RepID=A0ABW3J7H9_9HYPH
MRSAFRNSALAAFSGVAVAMLAAAPATAATTLRVCADPNNLPYSKKDGSGFENKIAEILADQMNAKLEYYWMPQRRGFLRETIKAGHCDVVMGVPSAMRTLETTRPYYRSSYVFLQRKGDPTISSYDDPALKKLKIGVQLIGEDGLNTPPVHDLGRRGIVDNIEGYMVYGDPESDTPLSPVVDAVADGDVDVSIVWGPIAGYYAKAEPVPLKLTPILIDPSQPVLQMAYGISIGTRHADLDLHGEVSQALRERSEEIDAVLADYGVPRIDKPQASGK